MDSSSHYDLVDHEQRVNKFCEGRNVIRTHCLMSNTMFFTVVDYDDMDAPISNPTKHNTEFNVDEDVETNNLSSLFG